MVNRLPLKRLALIIFFALFTISAYATTTQPVVAYTFACTGNAQLREGACPQGGRPDSLIQGTDGNFYGAAQVSSEGSSAPLGGTVFSLTPTGTLKVLHTFVPGPQKNYAQGVLPGALIEGPDGKLYGDTLYGGINGCNGYCGYGLLYRVNTDGTGFQVIHKFCSQKNCADGYAGYSMVVGTDGNLYGTTYYGGTGSCGTSGCGTLFRVTPSTGAYKVVYNFSLSTSGEDPSALIVAADGTFYGLSESSTGEMLFHYTEATGQFTAMLLPFPLFNGLPSRGSILTLGPNGNLYGIYGIYGVSGLGLFEVDADGSNLQLFSFYTTQDGGGDPQGMLLATDGNLWINDYNGSDGYGDILTVSPTDGSLIQAFSFFSSTAAVGAYPGVMMQASDGTIWGATGQFGKVPKGKFADGTVFSVNFGLPPK
jgi:uncharacterized repeat protein (TIGR03803 family)